ncbi:unnamed protein product [Durusdinium trenchii]|uniref:Uncharacterized protein n=1 Tax=Durusdinium trenchii TaxID=1381693 RepID=A0ABP0P5H1_9DINO
MHSPTSTVFHLSRRGVGLAVLVSTAFGTSTTEEVANTTSTTSVPEFSYYVGDWAACSTTCAIGNRLREVFCYRTCSIPRSCTSGVTDFHCTNIEKPSSSELCYGAEPFCPATTTITSSISITRTATTSTATVVTKTTTRGVRDGWECVPLETNDCVPAQIAASQCGAHCSCCRRSTTQAPFIPTRTTTTAPPSDDSYGLLIAVLVGLVLTAACFIVVFAVVGWRYYNSKPKLKQKRSERSAHNTHPNHGQAQTYGASTGHRSDRIHPDEPEKTVFDRKLGRGVASAAPGGFYDGPPDWMDEEAGMSSKTPSPRSAYSRAFSHSAFGADKDESAKSSPSRRRRQETEQDRPEERPSPTAPSGTLPPGYASAARRNRREGKEPPDVGAEPEQPQDIPGQARGDGEVGGTNKGSSQTQGKKSAAPPSEDSKPGPASSSKGGDSKSNKDSPRGAENASRSKSGAASGASCSLDFHQFLFNLDKEMAQAPTLALRPIQQQLRRPETLSRRWTMNWTSLNARTWRLGDASSRISS